jgi:hypothetical protein
MLDSDLAELYEVTTGSLNLAVRRNLGRFPEDFMFQLIIRAFIKLREVLATHKDLARKIDDLEDKYQEHDHELKVVFDAIRKLIATPAPTKRRIGFAAGNS